MFPSEARPVGRRRPCADRPGLVPVKSDCPRTTDAPPTQAGHRPLAAANGALGGGIICERLVNSSTRLLMGVKLVRLASATNKVPPPKATPPTPPRRFCVAKT